MRRGWIAALLALAACASVFAAEDQERQKVHTAVTPYSGTFELEINFSEAVDFSMDDIHVVETDDSEFLVLIPHDEMSSGIQIVLPPLVGGEDGRNRTQTLDIFEDMNIFGAVLADLVRKAFPEEPFFDKLRIRPVYLGRGCLYMINSPFPMANSRPSGKYGDMDKAWDDARRKLGFGPDESYDPLKAQMFQKAVRSAFKYASNMRHFADADFIAVSVMNDSGMAPTYFTARAEFGDLVNLTASAERMDVSTAQGGAAVMARVLDKMLQEQLGDKYNLGSPDRLYTESPFPVSRRSLGNGAGGVYLEGYGALFVADALFPLASRSEEDLWEQSARELRGGRTGDRFRTAADSGFRPGEPYGLQLFGGKIRTIPIPVNQLPGSSVTTAYGSSPHGNEEQLKERLTEAVMDALKYASRIQGMDAEEQVAVLIRGMENTQMSFRALKRDVDAYGKGELTREQFQETLSMQAEAHSALGTAFSPRMGNFSVNEGFSINPTWAIDDSPQSMTLTFWPPKPGETRNVMKLDGIEVSMEELSARIQKADSERGAASYVGLVLLRSKSDVEVDQGLLAEVKNKSLESDIVVLDDLLLLKEGR